MTSLKLAVPSKRRIKRDVSGFGVIRQIRIAIKRENRLAAVVGAVLGGFVPAATFTVAHLEADWTLSLHSGIMMILVAGGLAFSARTVFDCAVLALRNPVKAIGFVVLSEGAMTFSRIWPLNIAALCVLAGINAAATACNLAVNRRDAREVE